MQTEALNKIAKLLQTTDKNLVITAAIKSSIESGLSVDQAIDFVLGEGTFKSIANSLWEANQ